MIKNLKELSKKNIPIAGGKAANLGELINAGFNVPKGFCITTEAFEYYVKNKKFPADFEKELKNSLSKMKAPFAVRSSATTEDLAKASFAGQHDTFLNVRAQNVHEKIKECFSSLYTQRAVAYRKQNKISESRAKMAVVVQEMVNADFAGVCFTLDPVQKKFLLIEIVKGLGEKLVSGSVTPNSYFLDRKSLAVKKKNEMFNAKVGIGKIGKTFLAIERHYKIPMDIEFCIKAGKVYIVQARPITT